MKIAPLAEVRDRFSAYIDESLGISYRRHA